MKAQWQEVSDYLNKQLKRQDIEGEHRTYIEGTLTFLEHENNRGKEDWKLFVKRMKSKIKEWRKNFPVEGYDYSINVYESNGLRTLSLSLKGETHSTSLVEVEAFKRPENEIYISTIDSKSDEKLISNFSEVDAYVEKMFKSNSFENIVKFCISK